MRPAARRYRAPTAPSIPTHAQSYGYEETRSGELIRQKPPHEGFSGSGADTVLLTHRAALRLGLAVRICASGV
jgi:hypothetical protein